MCLQDSITPLKAWYSIPLPYALAMGLVKILLYHLPSTPAHLNACQNGSHGPGVSSSGLSHGFREGRAEGSTSVHGSCQHWPHKVAGAVLVLLARLLRTASRTCNAAQNQ